MKASSAVETGLAVVDLARGGRFTAIRDLFAPQLRTLASAEMLHAAWEAGIGRAGAVTGIGTPVEESSPGHGAVVKVPLACEQGALTLVVAVTDAGALAGLQLLPGESGPAAPWTAPEYADRAAFDEADVILGSGPLAVPGTLSVPRGQHALPGVVLLAGSGPNDRDETIGPNKPFRDLAWGLASSGVAVLRFDKVTHAHPAEVRSAVGFTLTDEYVPHAIAGVELLRRHPAVDAARVFVAGHSLGGTVAPRVAAAAPSVAGLVILAGGTEPLHWVLVRQVRHLASLDPATAAASEPVIQALTAQAQLVDSPALTRSTPASELPAGLPASYWLDLRDYDPAGTAAGLGRPILVLQGGRDYQATVADDLPRWQAALADRPDATIRIYPEDDHLFVAGSGQSTPAETLSPHHVDPRVVADIAAWLKATRISLAGAHEH